MQNPGKIVQLIYFRNILICLTENGHMFLYNPDSNTYEYLNEGIPYA